MTKKNIKHILRYSMIFIVILIGISLIYFSEIRGSIQPILSPVWLFVDHVLRHMIPSSIVIMLLSAYHFGYPLFYSFIIYKILGVLYKENKDNRKIMKYKILSTILIAIIFNLTLAPFEAVTSNTVTISPFIFNSEEADNVYPGDKDRQTHFIWLRITLGAVTLTSINFHFNRIKEIEELEDERQL